MKSIYDQLYSVLYIMGGFFPSIIAICMTYRREKSLHSFRERLTVRGIGMPYILFIFFSTLAIVYLPKVMCHWMGEPVKITCQQSFSGRYAVIQFVLYFVAVTLFGGGVNEEFGWRGYLLPRLMEKHNRLLSGVCIGIVWTCWHIPLFLIAPDNYVVGSFTIEISLLIYLLETVWLSILFVWLFYKTKQSLLAVILFHGMDNTVLSSFAADSSAGSLYYIIQTVIRAGVMVFVLADWHHETKKRTTKYVE